MYASAAVFIGKKEIKKVVISEGALATFSSAVLFCVIVDLCLCNVCVCFYGHVVFGWMFLYSFNLLVQFARGTTWFLVKNPTQS